MTWTRTDRGSDLGVATGYWIDDNGEAIGPIGPSELANPVEALQEVGQWCSHQIDKAREIEARPGPRFGQPADQVQRTGSSEDVVAALRVSPAVVVAVARRGDIFDPPLKCLTVKIDSLEISGRSCSWQATLKTGRYRRRPATLRIEPSPSGVLTILQLVPASSRRYRTRSFVTAGALAVSQLSDRLAPGRTARNGQRTPACLFE